MSLLSYASHSVLFAASIGGIAVGASLLSFGKSSVQSLTTKPFILTSGESNCKVVNELKKVIDFFYWSSSHIPVSCSSRGIQEKEDVVLGDKWMALFPRKFFNDGSVKEWADGQELIIHTETEVSDKFTEETFKTRFRSDEFSVVNKEVIGRWDYDEIKGSNGELVYPVRVVSPKNTFERIYFIQDISK